MESPALSVVIAAVNGKAYLSTCLQSLMEQDGAQTVEIVVVYRQASGMGAFLLEHFPAAVALQAEPDAGLPEMRALGLDNAHGRIIALTEDHCRVPTDWCTRIIEAHRRVDAPVIGGPLINAARGRLLDRLVFMAEYMPFAAPLQEGPVPALAAANVSYKRDLLAQRAPSSTFSEWHFHEDVKDKGAQLWCVPGLILEHSKHFTLLEYLQERFAYSRWFSARRARTQTPGRNGITLLLLWTLPGLGLIRTGRAVAARQGEASDFFLGIPFFITAGIFAAAGEIVGLLLGMGNSARKLK